ncbi:MAG: efflux RND transporter periplasmic adaptor subunit [Planctomycetaceae bacterium]|nr:efflux RND transporter periplasmic adaptor subunit [Planctomycetaceae bacterium]
MRRFPFSRSQWNICANYTVLTVLALCCIALNGCGSKAGGAAGPMGGPGGGPAPLTVVVTDEVQQRDIQLYIYVPGQTVPYKYVDITARVSGYLEKLYFQNGSIVKEGDKLALIEQDQYEIALKVAQAELDSAKAKEALAKANLERSKQLIDSRAMSPEEYNQRQAEFDMARAATARAEAAIEQAKLNLRYTIITAPIPGKTTKNLVDIGNFVSPGNRITATGASGEATPSDKLLSIAQMDPMYVDFQISDKQFADIKERMGYRQSFDEEMRKLNAENVPAAAAEEKKEEEKPEDVKKDAAAMLPSLNNNTAGDGDRRIDISLTTGVDVLSADYPVRGRVVYLADNRITYATGGITLRGEVRNPRLNVNGNEDYMIYPGQICRVRIPYEKVRDAVLVSESAILTDLDTKYVLVIVKEMYTPKDQFGKPKIDPKTDEPVPATEQYVIHRRTIKTGPLLDTQERIVKEGLEKGETYIVKGVQRARIGTPVNPVKLADFEEQRVKIDSK